VTGDPPGRVGTTSPTALAAAGALGLVLGSAVRPLVERAGGIAPTVPWLSVLTLLFLAAVLGGLALDTHRTLQVHHDRMQPQRAVALLVLGKACAISGAVVAGGYLGFGLSFVGSVEAALPRERVVRSAFAVVMAVAVVATALLLERACRVPTDPDDELPA
jgi:hypothetical protein